MNTSRHSAQASDGLAGPREGEHGQPPSWLVRVRGEWLPLSRRDGSRRPVTAFCPLVDLIGQAERTRNFSPHLRSAGAIVRKDVRMKSPSRPNGQSALGEFSLPARRYPSVIHSPESTRMGYQAVVQALTSVWPCVATRVAGPTDAAVSSLLSDRARACAERQPTGGKLPSGRSSGGPESGRRSSGCPDRAANCPDQGSHVRVAEPLAVRADRPGNTGGRSFSRA